MKMENLRVCFQDVENFCMRLVMLKEHEATRYGYNSLSSYICD